MAVDASNLEMLKEIIGDDLKEILEAFQMTLPQLLTSIENGISDQDASAVQLHSHTLKGSSANIGANDLSALSAKLEQLAKTGEITAEYTTILSEIKTESVEVDTFVRNFMNSF